MITDTPIRAMNLRLYYPKLDVITEEYEPDNPLKRKRTDEKTTNDYKVKQLMTTNKSFRLLNYLVF